MYILTTANGQVMKFYVAGVARLYSKLYGGEIVYIEEVADEAVA